MIAAGPDTSCPALVVRGWFVKARGVALLFSRSGYCLSVGGKYNFVSEKKMKSFLSIRQGG